MNQIRTSIVVLCYNGLEETTRPCMESIVANTPVGSYELIVVDNASADGTADYLKTFAAQHANVRIQLNDTNKGYAGGNNDGMKLAQGKYIVLLNNDTLVPKGWLERLLRLFAEHSDVGLIGPITNSAGNEQRIELPGLNEKNYEKIANAYIERQQGVWFNTEKLGFYCVAIRSDVPKKIGLLDERFGIGMFEDDDYCVRAKKAGYKLAVVEDCFVYHKGSFSFKKVSISNYLEIFSKNKSYFYEKHGILWTYTDVASAMWRKILGDLFLIEKGGEIMGIDRIMARAEGMTNSLFQLREVEQRNAGIGEEKYIVVQLVEKQKQLMEISDWATSMKLDNESLLEKQKQLMEISDWATSLKLDNESLIKKVDAMSLEMDAMSHSRLYRVFRYLQRYGV